ncbi:zinc finger, CCHC-type containing protein [Tanacetum coccineum]
MDVAAMKHMASNFSKLDKFKGMDFRRWQKNMHFLLSSMSVVYVLTTPIPEDGGDNATVEQIRKRAKMWNLPKNYRIPWRLNIWLRMHQEELTLVELGSHLHIEESSRCRIMTSQKATMLLVLQLSIWPSLVLDDDVAWWVDSGATVHVCKDRCWFKTYESLNDGSIHHMGNESTTLVHGRGCVDLRFSSGKVVSLLNVLHVPNIRKNLVSSSVLNNCGYKQVIESNKFVLSKHGVFIGFGYLSNHMFRLNIVSDNIGSAFMSTSKLNDSILWHARLGHVHFKRMQDMSKDGLIPAFDMDTENDLCDLHATPSLGNKKYFVTFIDDASRTDRGVSHMDTLYFSLLVLSMGCTDCPHTLQQHRAVVRLPDLKLKTLGERGIKCIFAGYAEHSKAFRFYVFSSVLDQRSQVLDKRTEDSGGSVVSKRVTDEIVQQSEPRKSKRHRTPTGILGP